MRQTLCTTLHVSLYLVPLLRLTGEPLDEPAVQLPDSLGFCAALPNPPARVVCHSGGRRGRMENVLLRGAVGCRCSPSCSLVPATGTMFQVEVCKRLEKIQGKLCKCSAILRTDGAFVNALGLDDRSCEDLLFVC